MYRGVALTVVALGLLITAEYYKLKSLIWVFKPLASSGFLLAASHVPEVDRRLFTGLCFAWAGDILLIPDGDWAFQAGLGSFLLGHVCYTTASCKRGIHFTTVALSSIPLAIFASFVLKILSPSVPDELRIPVLVYIIVISAMVATAAGTHHTGVIIGAILFAASDLLVARQQFLAPGFTNQLIGWPLYYGAQLILAVTQ